MCKHSGVDRGLHTSSSQPPLGIQAPCLQGPHPHTSVAGAGPGNRFPIPPVANICSQCFPFPGGPVNTRLLFVLCRCGAPCLRLHYMFMAVRSTLSAAFVLLFRDPVSDTLSPGDYRSMLPCCRPLRILPAHIAYVMTVVSRRRAS